MDKLNFIKQLEELAALTLEPQERQKYADEFDSILEFIDVIKEADTAGLQVQPQVAEYKNLREDKPQPSLPREQLLANASITQEDSFVTAKVVG